MCGHLGVWAIFFSSFSALYFLTLDPWMELDVGISLSDDAVTFLACPGGSPCCSFTATERHILFGYDSGAVDLCHRDSVGISVLSTLSPAELSSSLSLQDPCDAAAPHSAVIDCLCASPCASTVSILHRRSVLTFAALEPNGLRLLRSVPLGRSYTNRATAHSWLDSESFLVGCLDGTVLAVKATSAPAEPPRVLLREESPIVQLSVNRGVVAISSVQRSAVAIHAPNEELYAHTIGTRARAEGFFGVCLCAGHDSSDACPSVYAARHNARVFEAAAESGVVLRTFRTPPEAELGVLKPIASTPGGDVLLWSEGAHFLSVLRLGQTYTQHITRRFDDVAIVSSTVLAREAIALCSDGHIMCVPLPGSSQEEKSFVKAKEDQVGDEEKVQEAEGTRIVRRTKRVKRKVVRVVRRRRSQREDVAEERHADIPSAGNGNKRSSGASSLSLHMTDANGQVSVTRSEEAMDGEGAANPLESIHSEECVPEGVPLDICDADKQSRMEESDEITEVTKASELVDFTEETLSQSSHHRFRAELDRLIRLFDVHVLHIGAHTDLHAAVRAFLPLLEEQLLDAGLLPWSFHDVMQPEYVLPTVDATQTLEPFNEAVKFFNTEESSVSALRNVLKSALTWSIRTATNAAETLAKKGEGGGASEERVEVPRWKETAHVLHVLLALPCSPACNAEDQWGEKMSVLEHTLTRCGTEPDFLPLVLALSSAATTHVVQTRGLPVVICGYEGCGVAMGYLQATTRALLCTMAPESVPPLLRMFERNIMDQSPHILDAFEESPYPACTFFAYFPYVFATLPSKSTLLALRHYSGVSMAYFQWALSSSVQQFVYQSLCEISANDNDKYKSYSSGKSRPRHRTVSRPLTRLLPEDLADGLVDLVLTLYYSAREVLSPNNVMPCMRILLQRRYTLLRWTMEAQRTRVLSLAAGDASSGDAAAVQVAERKIRRLEDSALELLCAHVPVAIAACKTCIHDVLDLLDELEFPEGVTALGWTREYIARCVTLKRVERLLPLFQLPHRDTGDDWVFLFLRAYESETLEVAMFFCLTVERQPERVVGLLESAFPSLLTRNGEACKDAQLEQVLRKLNMLC